MQEDEGFGLGGRPVCSPLYRRDRSPASCQAWIAIPRIVESRSRIFLLGAAGEQEENGLGASASGPARTLTQNVPLGSRVVSQKVNFLGQGNKGGLISSAVRRRTGEYPPARLLLPGGLEPRSRRNSLPTLLASGTSPFCEKDPMAIANLRNGRAQSRPASETTYRGLF